MSDAPNTSGKGLVGKTFGQYEVVSQLGKGGMATVYLGQQTSIGRQVAIKVMPPHFLHDDMFMQRFRREVQVIARLQHPRILPIYDYGEHEGQPYIVMAYMSGGTLEDKIRQGPMSFEVTNKIMRQMAEALDHAHRNGIIHRDFKPSNVLLDADDNVHLADFGIAKISEATVQLTGNAMVGTPAYMAPEMADRAEITQAVDIYALGVSLYQMLSGNLPFRGETPIKVLLSHTNDPVPDIRAVRPETPPAVAEVIFRAMSKQPEERYYSAGELAEELSKAIKTSRRPTEEVRIPKEVKPADDPQQTQALGINEPEPVTVIPSSPDVYVPEAPKKKKRAGLAIVVIALVVLSAICLGVLALTGVLGGGGGDPAVVVNNESSADICHVYISSDMDAGWGPDQLKNKQIAAGDSHTISGMAAGEYDLRAETCDGKNAVKEDVEINGPYTWTLGGN